MCWRLSLRMEKELYAYLLIILKYFNSFVVIQYTLKKNKHNILSLTQYMLNVLLDLNIRKRFQCLKLNLKTLIRSAPQWPKLLQAFRPIIWDGGKMQLEKLCIWRLQLNVMHFRLVIYQPHKLLIMLHLYISFYGIFPFRHYLSCCIIL